MIGPQAYSYGTVGPNKQIYLPPYGLKYPLSHMLKINPETLEVKKIKIPTDESTEKWIGSIVVGSRIYWLPYNESRILIVDTEDDSIHTIDIPIKGRGKWIRGHLIGNQIYSLPYGEYEPFKHRLIIDTSTNTIKLDPINVPKEDEKKWHTTQEINGVIHGLPRGENWETYFNYRIEWHTESNEINLFDMSDLFTEYDKEQMTNKKYTTVAKSAGKLYAPPYSENSNFDIMLKFINGKWLWEKTGLQYTSRMYFAHTVAHNGKIFFPPAGHEEDWSDMLVIDPYTDSWWTKSLGIGKESKKYFAGAENSQGKIYYIPRGGCVCEPEDTWKQFGDLAEILVLDSKTEETYTIDISEYFTDNTTIEKYNNCVIVDDKIFAFPYGESDSFQSLLVFDTIKEEMVGVIDLNEWV